MKTKPAKAAVRRAVPSRQPQLRRTCLALLIAACFGPAAAQPTLPQVVNGQATFAQQGNVFSITNTPNAIINWQSFSVNPGELTRFIQQSANSSVLNRITGQDPSRILGALQSNGRVFLVNPNGVLFGRDARIDVNGLVASSLAISNGDFLAGGRRFAAADGSAPGAVSNQGVITTPAGGQVVLLAPQVDNGGVINAPNGDVVLAAGRSVQLADAANPALQVVVSAPADRAVNLGQVIAQGGRIGIFGALVNQRGRLSADSAVLGENGKIVLKSSDTTLLEAGSSTSATGAGKGGEIELLGRRVGLTGDAGVDASGALGGGSILVGGDYRGANPGVMNAQQSYLGAAATLKADATGRGDGGKVVVWSDNATRVFGHISARGGAQGGDGGFVETSGHYLDMQGNVDTRAPLGKTGKLLLDPSNIYIAVDDTTAVGAGMTPTGAGTAGESGGIFSETSSAADSLLTTGVLVAALNGSNVQVTTSNANSNGAGFIKVVSPVVWGSGSALTLNADAGIALDAIVNGGSTGSLSLSTIAGDVTQSAPMTVKDLTVRANNGNVVLTNAGNTVTGNAALTAGQQVSLTAAAIKLDNSGGTDMNINTTGGDLTVIGYVSNSGQVSLNAGNGGNVILQEFSTVIGKNVALTGDNIAINGRIDGPYVLGDIVLTAGGANRAGGGSINFGGGVINYFQDGSVVLKADNMNLQAGTINAGIAAVTLAPTSRGQNIHLGVGATDASGTLGLSDSELRRIFTTGLLTVGDNANGNDGYALTVVGNLDLGGGEGTVSNLRLGAGLSSIRINAPLSVGGGLTLATSGIIDAQAALSVGGTFLLDSGSWVQNNANLPAFSARDFQVARGAASFLRVQGGDGSGSPYQIADVYGLQGLASLPMGNNYRLAADIDATGTAVWNGGAGFTPIGDGDGGNFFGVFDGAGRTISGLTINQPGTFNVGMFAALAGGTVKNFTLLGGSVTGGTSVGALVGDLQSSVVQGVFSSASVNGESSVGGLAGTNGGSISGSQAMGSVVGTGQNVGGLVGSNNGGISNSAASGSVTGERSVGGLVGNNAGTIQNAFALGAVTGTSNVDISHQNLGGLVGENALGATASRIYSSGAVTGPGFVNVGGVAGYNDGDLPFAYWNGEASGISTGIGLTGANGTSNAFLLSNAESMQQARFNGDFDFTSATPVWRIYEGHTGPLLKALLSPLTANVSATASRVYDGTQSHFAGSIAYTGLTGGDTAANGTLDYTTAARNVGNYALDGLWSTKYDISYSGATSLAITPRAVTVSIGGSKVYDGLTDFSGALFTVNNVASGDTLSASGSAFFDDKNAGTGKNVSASEVSLGGSGLSNYSFGGSASGSAAITPRLLSVTYGGNNRLYDGSTLATVGTSDDRLGSDVLSINAPASFGDKNVGTGKLVTIAGASLSGADAGNYTLATGGSTTADITVRGLNVTFGGVDKVYDGGVGASFTASDDRVAGDLLTVEGSASFGDKNVGPGKTVTVSGASLSGADAGNYILSANGGSVSAAITARLLQVSYSGIDKIYDGGLSASVTRADNRVAGDVLTVGGSASFGDKNAGAGKAIAISGAFLSGGDAANYQIDSASGSASAAITPRQLNVSYGGVNRVYDGGVAAGFTAGDDRIANDVVTVNASASFNDKNVGTGKAVTIGGASLSGGDAGNYTLASAGGATTADVTVRTLNATFSGVDKVYDGGLGATLSVADDRVAGDQLSVGASASFGDKNVGAGKTLTVSGITLSGSDAGNYALLASGSGVTAAITPRLLNVIYGGVNKIYDGSLSASFTSTDNRVAGDVLTVAGSASFGDKNVGAGKAVSIGGAALSGGDAGNYTLAATGSATADITVRTLNASFSGVNKVYDGGLGASVTAVDDRVAGDVLSVNGSASFGDKNVGAGKSVTINGASLSGTDAGNYALVSAGGPVTADITVRTLNAVFGGVDKVYDGGVNATLSVTDDRVAGDLLSVDASATFGDKNVGAGKAVSINSASLSGSDAGNYALAASGSGVTAAITPRLLNVTYNGLNKVYDGALSASVGSIDDRLDGDVLSVGGSASFGDKNVGAGKAVSVSGASLSGADAGNYLLASAGGATTADITVRTLNASFSGVNKIYDGGVGASFASTDDRVAGDVLTLGGSASFGDKNVGAGKAVGISGVSLSGADAGNYTLANAGGSVTADITARMLNLNYSAGNKVYDGNVNASVSSSDDRVAGDVLNVSQSASFADKNAGANKKVTLASVALSGADAGNYVLNFSPLLFASISQANLSLGGVSVANRVYDGTLQASVSGATLGGVIGQDQVFVSGGQGSFSDKNVGTGKLVKVNGFVLGGADAGNYALGSLSADASADITARTLQLRYTAAGKVYDGGTLASLSGVADDRVAGDVLDISQRANFADKNVGAAKAVTVSDVVLGGADGGNYVVAVGGPLFASITPASLGLSGVSVASRVYDGGTDALVSASLDGVIGGDAVNLSGGVGRFDDKNVGVGKNVAISGFRLSGADAGNYQFAPGGMAATADITQKALATWVGTAGGLWSDAGNWDGGAVPDGANVLDVNLAGSGVVNYSASAGATSIRNLNGGQGLSVSGGSLTLGYVAADRSLLSGGPGLNISGGNLVLRGGLTVDDYAQSGGVVGGAGSLNVRRSFSQSAGNLGIDGVLAIVQASGDLRFSNLSAASVSLSAEAGRISQSGPVVSASLTTRSQNGVELNNAGNRVGSFSASNSGGGGIALTNVSNPGTLVLGTLSSGAGDIVIDNTGGIQSHAINANGGNVSLTAHSPIQVDGAISGADIALSASTDIVLGDAASLDALSDVSMSAGSAISLQGAARVNAGGNIALAAGTGVALDGTSSLTARSGSINIATATGSIVAGSGASISGASVLLSAPKGAVVAPSSVFSGGAVPVVDSGAGTSPSEIAPLTAALNTTINLINTSSSGGLNLAAATLPPLGTVAADADADAGPAGKGGVAQRIDDARSKSNEQGTEKNDGIKKTFCN